MEEVRPGVVPSYAEVVDRWVVVPIDLVRKMVEDPFRNHPLEVVEAAVACESSLVGHWEEGESERHSTSEVEVQA